LIKPPEITAQVAISLIFSCFLSFASWAGNDPAKIHTIVDTAVGVTINGQAFFFNYGVASREENTAISEATLFEIGSVSKTFTATPFSCAQVLGKLSLADHPSKYMPQLKYSAIDKVSLLNLGTYTAGGLPLQFPEGISDDEMTDYFAQWKPDALPSTQRRYSNPSLGLFGHIAAIALKSEFSNAMETRLFPELGLSNTYIRVPKSAMATYAWGYNSANKPVRVNPGVFAAEAYGVKSTAFDMIRFVHANIAPRRLSKPIRRAVEGTHVGYFKIGEIVQGLGREQYPYPISLDRLLAGNSLSMVWEPNPATQLTRPSIPVGATLYGKTGSTAGFGSYVVFVPKKKIGIVLLANKNYPVPARIKAAHSILEQLAP
jgi:beta-lactamase class C